MVCEGKNCWCDLEWFCEHAGLARVFGGGEEYGDPYCYALPFVVRDKERKLIEFIGVLKVMQSCQYRCLRKAMREAGWGILSTRVKDGQSRTIEICKRGPK
jgi:hypothetical protein